MPRRPRRASSVSRHSSSGTAHGSARSAACSERARSRKCACVSSQWRKWRRAVNTIVAPDFSTASITSWSRREPPGWTIAVMPASSAIRGPSGNGKNASDASAEPARSCPYDCRLLHRDVDRVDAAHLSRADADRLQVLRRARSRSTRRACTRATRRRGRPTAFVRRAADDLPAFAVLDVGVGVLDEHAAEDALVVPRVDVAAALAVDEDPRVLLLLECSERVVAVARARRGPRRTARRASRRARRRSRGSRRRCRRRPRSGRRRAPCRTPPRSLRRSRRRTGSRA